MYELQGPLSLVPREGAWSDKLGTSRVQSRVADTGTYQPLLATCCFPSRLHGLSRLLAEGQQSGKERMLLSLFSPRPEKVQSSWKCSTALPQTIFFEAVQRSSTEVMLQHSNKMPWTNPVTLAGATFVPSSLLAEVSQCHNTTMWEVGWGRNQVGTNQVRRAQDYLSLT